MTAAITRIVRAAVHQVAAANAQPGTTSPDPAAGAALEIPLTTPPDPALGDYAVPCFRLAQQVAQKPVALAAQLLHLLQQTDLAALGIARVETRGPYLNFHLRKGDLAARVISTVLEQGERYGATGSGLGQQALVEHTSINPNASPHLGPRAQRLDRRHPGTAAPIRGLRPAGPLLRQRRRPPDRAAHPGRGGCHPHVLPSCWKSTWE